LPTNGLRPSGILDVLFNSPRTFKLLRNARYAVMPVGANSYASRMTDYYLSKLADKNIDNIVSHHLKVVF